MGGNCGRGGKENQKRRCIPERNIIRRKGRGGVRATTGKKETLGQRIIGVRGKEGGKS